MFEPRYRLLLFAMIAMLGLIACGTSLSNAPTPPGGKVQSSDAAAEDFEKVIRNQLFDPTKSDFRIGVTNQQATSYLNRRNTLPLENPQVWFTQGKVYIRGTYTGLCLFHPDVLIVAAPRVKDKMILANVQQIHVGTFALPQDWLPTISQSITDSIEDARINLTFERIDILEGEFVISGSKRQS